MGNVTLNADESDMLKVKVIDKKKAVKISDMEEVKKSNQPKDQINDDEVECKSLEQHVQNLNNFNF